MKKIKKILFVVLTFIIIFSGPVWAEKTATELFDEALEIGNKIGLNDGCQQGVGHLGNIFAKFGCGTVDWAYEHGNNNQNISYETVRKFANRGTQIFINGKIIEYVGRGAPHAGWISSGVGRWTAEDYSGVAIVAANGLARTLTVAAAVTAVIGTAAVAAAPALVVVATGVVVAVGVGKIWDETVGAVANTIDNRMLPWIDKTIVKLNHTKFIDTLIALNVKSPDAYLNCLCRNAGYGQSNTSQFYHPDTLGDFDERYTCQHPGEPCVVAGYGCTRHPLPKDPKIIDSCMQLNRIGMKKDKDGTSILIGKRLDELLYEEVKSRAAKKRAGLSAGENNNLSGGVGKKVPGTEPKK